jgi:hypothetical protein
VSARVTQSLKYLKSREFLNRELDARSEMIFLSYCTVVRHDRSHPNIVHRTDGKAINDDEKRKSSADADAKEKETTTS